MGSKSDEAFATLGALGLTGTLADREYAYLSSGSGSFADKAKALGLTPRTPMGSYGGGGSSSRPTALTTGSSGTLTPSLQSTFNVDSAVFEDMHFTDPSYVNVYGNNVTFTNCKFDGLVTFTGADNTQVVDCDFVRAIGVSSSVGLSILRARMVDWFPGDAIHIAADGGSNNEDISIIDSYFFNAIPDAAAHADGIQVRGSDGLILRNNVFDLGPYRAEHNAALMLQEDIGPNTNFLIENNYFGGGGYTCFIHQGQGMFRNNQIRAGNFSEQYDPAPVGIIDGGGNTDGNGDPYLIHY